MSSQNYIVFRFTILITVFLWIFHKKTVISQIKVILNIANTSV